MTERESQPSLRLQSGDRIPTVGFGTWQIEGGAATEAVIAAIGAGYRHIDTATVYENEAAIGKALRACALSRDDLFVTTKVPPDHLGRARGTLEASLEMLGLEFVDLWLIHWPPHAGGSQALWEEMIALQLEGLTRAIGVSNFDVSEIDALASATGVTPAVNQIRWSPFIYDPIEQLALRERAVILEGYSPFKTSNLDDPILLSIAKSHAVSPAQVIIRWHIQHDIVAIPKSVTPERIVENFDVFDFSLDHEEMGQLDTLRVR